MLDVWVCAGVFRVVHQDFQGELKSGMHVLTRTGTHSMAFLDMLILVGNGVHMH